jgi:mono/diheme cytochrome c family protein
LVGRLTSPSPSARRVTAPISRARRIGGADGTLPAPPHDEHGHTWHHSDEILFGITKHGGQRNAPAGFVSRMPGFAATMSDKQIHAVLAYIKSRWPEAVRSRQELINARSR